MSKHYRKENNCLNCGSTVQGKFCSNCGQENLEIRENFSHLMNHAISDYFHFDHQFFNTLKPLLFKPGFLTNEYMAGKRVKYLHPVKMYIFISVVYFLLAFQQRETQAKVNFNIKVPTEKQANKQSNTKSESPDSTYEQYQASQLKLPASKRDGAIVHWGTKKAYAYSKKYGKNSLEVFQEQVEHNIPKSMFVLMPLFALGLQIAFRKNKKFYVEHLIYSFHFHCFLFLLSSVVIALALLLPLSWTAAGGVLAILEFVFVLIYFYKSLRVVYHRSRFRTLTKMIGITLSYLIMAVICLWGVVVLTFSLS